MAGEAARQMDGDGAGLSALRLRVYVRDGGYCTYCGRVLTVDEVVLDHDEHGAPWHQVPEHRMSCACEPCHSDKGRRTRGEYRAHRRMLHAHEMRASLAGR